MKKGKVIVIEGVDGAGKTTQKGFLKDFLQKSENREKYGETIFVKEPGGTEAGWDIRKVILDHTIDSKTEALLFYASRNELLKRIVLPAIESGKNVVYDRFELSTFAYQIYGRQKHELKEFIFQLSEEIVPKDFVDRYYFFDLDVEIAKERELDREEISDRFDSEGIEFFNRIRNGYKEEIKRFPHKTIDASESIKKVKKDFLEDLIEFLKEK